MRPPHEGLDQQAIAAGEYYVIRCSGFVLYLRHNALYSSCGADEQSGEDASGRISTECGFRLHQINLSEL